MTLHAGISLDGKLTDKAGHSRWVTSEEGRRLSHSLRGEFSAILAGRGTILADDPQLNLREPGWEGKTLYRVVLDSANSLPGRLNIFKDQEQFPLVIFSSRDAADQKKKFRGIFSCPMTPMDWFWPKFSVNWDELGIASLLVEGGGRVLIPSFASGCSTRWPCSSPTRSSAAGIRSRSSPPGSTGLRMRRNWLIAAGANTPAASC